MESVSIVDPQTCCFLKVLAYEFELNAVTLNDRIKVYVKSLGTVWQNRLPFFKF